MAATSSTKFLGCFVVWAPFAACGYWSAGLFRGWFLDPWIEFVPPFPIALPFAALCALFLLRSSRCRLAD